MSSYAFNPFTSNLDIVGSGASYIDGVVATPASLPVTLNTPPLDAVFLAKAGSGVWLLNRRPGGLYCRVANNGNANDWVHLGAFPEVNADGNWELYNSADPTKELKFDLSGLPTATIRTVTAPAGNGQMLVEGQSIGATTRNTGAFTTLSATGLTEIFAGGELRAYNSYTNATTYEAGIFRWSSNELRIGYERGSAGIGNTSRAVRIQVNNTNSCLFTAAGSGVNITCRDITVGSSVQVGNALLSSGAALNVLEQRNGTAAQTFNIFNTVSGSSNENFERGFLSWSGNAFRIGTEAAGTGSNRNIEFVLGGATRLTLSTSGDLTWGSTGSITLPSAASFTFSGRGGIRATAQGSFRFLGSDGSTFNLLHLGVESASYPALKRVGTALQVRLGDDSAFADFECGGSTFNSLMIIRNSSLLLLNGGSIRLQTSAGADTAEIVRDAAGIVALRSGTTAHSFRVYNTSTSSNANFERANFRWAANEFIIDAEAGGTGTSLRGIKIGSATSSLLGFYGATPVDRPATVADPTGGGTVDTEARTAINDIIDRLQELGLIA